MVNGEDPEKSIPRLEVFPSCIEFEEIETQVRYIMTLIIQNTSTKVLRYKITPPASSQFTIVNLRDSPTRLIAPGMEVSVDVQFEATSAQDVVDELVVSAQGVNIVVPITARIPACLLEMEESMDIGHVVLSTKASSFLDIVNYGVCDGNYTIVTKEGSHLKITPSSGCVPADITHPSNEQEDSAMNDEEKNQVRIKVELEGAELGDFCEEITVQIQGQMNRTVQVMATIVLHRLEFKMANDSVLALPFGSIYYGRERTVVAHLVNNGPKPVAFQATLAILSDSRRETNEDEDSESVTDAAAVFPDLSMDPIEGVVSPYSETPFTFLYRPIKPKLPKGWSSTERVLNPIDLTATLLIESSDLVDQSITVEVTGQAVHSNVTFSSMLVDFGECTSGARVDVPVIVTNTGVLPATYEMNKVAHFSCRPKSGRLESLQSQTLVFSFTPAQLGNFRNTLQCIVGSGLQTLSIKVTGHSEHVGFKSNQPRGPAAVPEDFEPTFNFATTADIMATKDNVKPFTRKNGWQKALDDGTAIYDADTFATGPDTHLTYCLSDQQQHEAHKSGYNQYLKESHKNREKNTKSKLRQHRLQKGSFTLHPNNPVNIGIEPQSGMEGPVPKLPKPSEKLWLKSEGGNKSRNVRQHDETRLIKKKFKSFPVTQAERKDCETQLSTEQLKLVTAVPRLMQFGQVCVLSVNKRCFAVTNDLKQSICVTIKLAEDGSQELQGSSPTSQVIPAGCTAGFDIELVSKNVREFDHSFYYVINGHHVYKIGVQADIVPISIELSKELIEFHFPRDNFETSIIEPLVISNPGNAHARYALKFINAGAFTAQPTAGSIAPGQTTTVQFTYRPQHGIENQAAFEVHVDGGEAIRGLCVGKTQEPKCLLRDKKLDFGKVATGSKTSLNCVLANVGRGSAVFYIDALPEEFGISIFPMQGRLETSEVQTLRCEMQSCSPLTLSQTVEKPTLKIHIRGGKTVLVPIVGSVIVPEVSVAEESLDFGAITLGVTSSTPFALCNNSTIKTSFQLDLTKFVEFTAMLEKGETLEWEDGSVKVKQIYTPLIGGEDAEKLSEKLSEEELICRQWFITIPPGRTVNITLIYSPVEIRCLSFPLPLWIDGMSQEDTANGPVQPTVLARGNRPRLLLSKTVVDYGERVVSRDTLRKVPHHFDITLTNDDEERLSWTIQNPILVDLHMQAIFKISPMTGILDPKETVTVRLTFVPNNAKCFAIRLPVFLDDQTEREYVGLTLKGAGIWPHLTFNVPEVVLPTVPLGVVSIATFSILNTGYDNLEIKYRLPVDISRVPITVSFPTGKTVGVGNPSTQVQVRFSSHKPLCFTAKLEFYDNEGIPFTIPITGTTDNCLLTNYDFVSHHRKTFDFFPMAHKGIHFMDKACIKAASKTDASEKQLLLAGEIDASYTFLPVVEENSVSTLLNWLNLHLCKDPISSFPADLLSTNGAPVYDMITAACGRTVPGKVVKLATNKREQWAQLTKQYTELLRFLKSYGAMLNSIRPEHLLHQDDYIRCKEAGDSAAGLTTRLGPTAAAQRRKTYEDEWKPLCVYSWLNILFQIVKTFVLFRVTPRAFEELPGILPLPISTGEEAPEVEETKSNSRGARTTKVVDTKKTSSSVKSGTFLDKKAMTMLKSSNVYSTSEGILLKWLEHHVNATLSSAVEEPRTLLNFEEDLKDGSVLGLVLLSHVPHLGAPGRALHSLHKNPQGSLQNITDNGKMIQNALQELGIDFGLSSTFLTQNARDMVLLVLHLYETLPQYIPKTVVEFSGALGQVLSKCIELKNPSSSTRIEYQVSLEGSSEFQIQGTSLVLEPLATASFVVELRPRFTRSVNARLTFSSSRDGSTTATTMVFGLLSFIHTRTPIKSMSVTSKTYDGQNIEIDITNQFPVDAQYQLVLIQDAAQNEIQPGRQNASRTASEKSRAPAFVVTSSYNGFMESYQPFHCKTTTIPIKKGATTTLSVNFLALQTGKYRCNLLFLDENVGEFMYEITAEATLPDALDVLTFSTEMKPNVSKVLSLPVKNAGLQKAFHACVERLSGGIKSKVRDVIKKGEEATHTTYSIELNSPFWTSSSRQLVTMSGNARKGSSSATETKTKAVQHATFSTPQGATSVDVENQCMLMLQPKGAGTYPCKLILRSEFDMRVYDLEATVTAPGMETILEFSAPSRQVIVQNIPILNDSDKPWTLRATLSGSKVFTGPASMTIAAGKTAHYPLSFKPTWICDTMGNLVLLNANSDETFDFALKGIGEEPLAEDHVILTGKARDVIKYAFRLLNLGGKEGVTYAVESDLPHVSGASAARWTPTTSTYELVFTPLIGGTYSGSITFKSSNGEFFWYTIEAEIESPDPESVLDIEANVRGAVAVDISLVNPLDESIEFHIELDGDGLLGEKTFVLNARETRTYELIFSPLLEGNQKGAIHFSNEYVGEFWYRLALSALPAPPTTLPKMCCAVGSVCSQSIRLDNPTGERAVLSFSVDNRRNYSIRENNLILEAYGYLNVMLNYTPSSLTVTEEATIHFVHAVLGTWEFQVKGTGLPPARMKETILHARIGEATTSMFTFRNPFHKEMVVHVHLENTAVVSTPFKLMHKRSSATLSGFSTVQIPISFSPANISEYRTNIVIENKEALKWTYPLVGISEAPVHEPSLVITCRARETHQQQLVLPLFALDNIPLDETETFTYELTVPSDYQRLVDRALVLTPVRTELTGTQSSVEYTVRFDPLRPFSTQLDLTIRKGSGGQWRFAIQLEASEPAIDDTIRIESALQQTSSVSFKLTNAFRQSASFHAEFSFDSSSAFTIFPTDGKMEPYGGESTPFVVSFTPTEYGRPLRGRLVIVTDEMQWTFEVKGVHPEYHKPIAQARVNSTLDAQFTSQLNQSRKSSSIWSRSKPYGTPK